MEVVRNRHLNNRMYLCVSEFVVVVSAIKARLVHLMVGEGLGTRRRALVEVRLEPYQHQKLDEYIAPHS